MQVAESGPGPMPRLSRLAVGVWSPDPVRAEVLAQAVRTAGYSVELLDTDAALVSAVYRQTIDLLVAEADERLSAQRQFFRIPFILVDGTEVQQDRRLASQAYATVSAPDQLALVLDRFSEHRALSARATARHLPPTRCSRCARPFESLLADTPARFVRFGTVSLCESCVGALRRLVRASERSLIEADLTGA